VMHGVQLDIRGIRNLFHANHYSVHRRLKNLIKQSSLLRFK
jgi:hypothetical protein